MLWQRGHGLSPHELGLLPNSAVCPVQPSEMLHLQRGKAVAFGVGMRAEAGLFYEVEAMTEDGWHRDRPENIRRVTFSSPTITLQV